MNEKQSGNCLLVFDRAGNLTDCNQHGLDFFNISEKNELAEQFSALSSKYPPENLACGGTFVEHIKKAIGGENIDIDWIFSRIDGKLIQACVKLVGIDINHALCQIRMRYEDDKNLKERLAIAEEQRVRVMLDSIPAICTFWDEGRNLIFCNQAAADLFGLDKPQDYLDRFGELSPTHQPCGAVSIEKALSYVDTAFETGYSQFDWMHQKPDGTPMPSQVTLIRVNWQGEYGLVGFTVDMREKNAEGALRQRLQAMLDASPMVCAIFDENINVVEVNQVVVDVLKLSNKQEYIDNFFALTPEFQPDGISTQEKAIAAFTDAAQFGVGHIEEWVMFDSTGENIPFELFLKSMDVEGKKFVIVYARDLREYYKIAEFESASKQRTQAMLDASPIICAIFDENVNVVETNQAAVGILKLANKQEYIDRFFELQPEFQPDGMSTQEKAAKTFVQTIQTGEGYIQEWMMFDSENELIPFEVHLKSMELDGKTAVVMYAHDLRESYKLMEAERKAGEMLNRLLEASPMFIEIRDDQLNLVDCNGQVESLFGAASREAFIEEYERYYPEYQPCGTPSKEKETALLKQAMQDGYAQFEYTHLTADGEELPLEFTYVRIQHNDKTTIVGYAYDLRHIRIIEKQRIEIAEESNRAKSRFLARMSHEIRTPISAVLGLSEIQLRNHVMPPQTEEVFAKIYDSAKILLNIVNDILDFSKIESGKMSLVNIEYDVASLISDAAHLHLVYLDHENVSFQLHVDEGIPSVLEGDALRIRQIMNNLLTNAFKYTESGLLICLSIAKSAKRDM